MVLLVLTNKDNKFDFSVTAPKVGRSVNPHVLRRKRRPQPFIEKWERVNPTFASSEMYVWILVMFSGGDQFLEIFLDRWFLLCVLTSYLLMCKYYWVWHFLCKTLSVAVFCIHFLQQCWSSYKFPHCAMVNLQYSLVNQLRCFCLTRQIDIDWCLCKPAYCA